MASGHRKRKAASLRIGVLNPIGLTNLPASEAGNTSNLNNLLNIATYSKNGTAPTFIQGKQGLLSDAVSNSDGVFTAGGLTGETTDASTLGLTANSRHYMFTVGTDTEINLSSSNQPKATTDDSIIVYSVEGPQSNYVPYYLGGSAKTGSIRFGTELTASALANISFTYFGKIQNGDKLQVLKLSDKTPYTKVGGGAASVMFDGNNLASTTIKVAKTLIAPEGGYFLVYSSSANTTTSQFPGIAVVVKPSS